MAAEGGAGGSGSGGGGGRSAVFACVRALLGNASRPVKAVCVCVMCGWGVSWWEGAAPLLAVTPGLLLPPTCALWTALSFCFLEAHLWAVVADVVTVGLCGKLVEPLWGRKEMLLFFAVTNVGVALVCTAYYLLLYTCTRNPDYLFDVRIHGLAGYIAAVSVAVKQVMPDHLLVKTSLGESLPTPCTSVSLVETHRLNYICQFCNCIARFQNVVSACAKCGKIRTSF